jgi:hypothetical protein
VAGTFIIYNLRLNANDAQPPLSFSSQKLRAYFWKTKATNDVHPATRGEQKVAYRWDGGGMKRLEFISRLSGWIKPGTNTACAIAVKTENPALQKRPIQRAGHFFQLN